MIEAVAKLQAQGVQFRPPATLKAIAALEAEIGTPLPQDLKEFLLLHDGTSKRGDLWFDLNSVNHIRDIYQSLEEWEWYESNELLRAGIHIGSDIGGNALVYLTLPECPNRIAYINHESTAEPQVQWRSLTDLLEHAAEPDGTPSFYPARAGERPDDEADANACIARWQASSGYEEPLFFLSLACNVLPQRRLDELIGWFNSVDLDQMRPIYRSLSARYRRDQPAERILETLEAGMLRAQELGGSYGSDLKWIAEAIVDTGSPNARDILLRLGETMSSRQLLALEGAFEAMGARVKRVTSPHGKNCWALSVQFDGDSEPILLFGQQRGP